jgi:hypothetical protein
VSKISTANQKEMRRKAKKQQKEKHQTSSCGSWIRRIAAAYEDHIRGAQTDSATHLTVKKGGRQQRGVRTENQRGKND